MHLPIFWMVGCQLPSTIIDLYHSSLTYIKPSNILGLIHLYHIIIFSTISQAPLSHEIIINQPTINLSHPYQLSLSTSFNHPIDAELVSPASLSSSSSICNKLVPKHPGSQVSLSDNHSASLSSSRHHPIS